MPTRAPPIHPELPAQLPAQLPTQPPPESNGGHAHWLLLLLFAVLMLAIAALGWGVYAHLARQFQAQENAKLLAIAQLKASQIGEWLDARRSDADLLARSPFLNEAVARWQNSGDPATEARLKAFFAAFRETYHYQSIVLLDAQDVPLLQDGEAHPVSAELRAAAARARLQGRGGDTDLYRSDALLPEHSHLDFVTPLAGGRVLVLRSAPDHFLFPFIQSWPLPSASAETLLLRRDGDHLLYLNELRHRKGAALRLRLPLSLETLPAAWAVRVGGSGTRAGQDYRQVPVLVAWHAVPGTHWMVIAKTDRAELLAPLRQQAWLIAAGVAFALIAAACLAWVLLRRWDMKQRYALLAVRLREVDAIATSERKFRTLIDNLPDIAWHKDAAGVYVSCNRRYAEALHLDDSEAIAGHRDDDFYPPELAAKYQADDRRVIDSGEELDSEEHWLKDGQPVWVHTRKAPVLDNDGRCVGSIGIARDITEHKLAELALQAYREQLEVLVKERTADLEAANADLEGFSYSVSHDLRAPLRAIDGFAAILREDYAPQLDAEGQRLFQVVSDNAQKMGQLIDDILAFSRAGRRELQQADLDMGALVGEVWQGLEEAQWSGRGRDLHLGELPSARGDPVAIRQVWLNLLGNALKFTRGRAPAVIEVGGRREGAENWYYVKDNGAGFDPAYGAKLFGLFSRLHGMDEFEGTGVGLAIVKRFIAKHGGRVWAEGRVGEGATFWFSLPCSDAL